MTAALVVARATRSFRGPDGFGRSVGAVLDRVVFWACVGVLALFLTFALWPGLLTWQDPLEADRSLILAPPQWGHILGTDEIGRDVYTRIVYGARASLFLGIGAVLLSLTVGAVLGLLAGLGRKPVSVVVMRLTDIGAAFPELLLAILIIALFGGGIVNATLAIGVAGIPYYVRVIRAEALRVRHSTYIEAARGLGLSRSRVLLRHTLPNSLRPVLVIATIGLGGATLAGAGLSFLGLGSAPPLPEWGSMLSNARSFLTIGWWAAVFPGLAITLFVVSTTVIGRRLQKNSEGRA